MIGVRKGIDTLPFGGFKKEKESIRGQEGHVALDCILGLLEMYVLCLGVKTFHMVKREGERKRIVESAIPR